MNYVPHRVQLQRCKPALRILVGIDGVEEGPVGFPGVEQRSDLAVPESSEPEGGAFDASGQVVDCGGAVGDRCFMAVDDLVMPTPQGATQTRWLRWTVRVGEILREFQRLHRTHPVTVRSQQRLTPGEHRLLTVWLVTTQLGGDI